GFQVDKEELVSEKVEDMVKSEVKRTFNPEFLNRLDEVIIFNALTDPDLIQILELLVGQLNTNLAQRHITITTRPAFIEVYLEGDRLFYRQVGEGAENTEGVLLYSN